MKGCPVPRIVRLAASILCVLTAAVADDIDETAMQSFAKQPPKLTLTDFFPFLKHLQNPLVRALILVVLGLILLLILAGIIRRASRQRHRSEIYEVRRREQLREPSPPLALFIVMLSKAHLTSHSKMSGSRRVIIPS